jgi:hypothetical protein
MTYNQDNTEGFSVQQTDLLNAALAIRLARGEDEKNASDAINNAWTDTATIETLTK